MKFLLPLFLLRTAVSHAEEDPFHHDILCQQTKFGSESQSVKIVYDKTTHHDLGRIGDIKVELNTGEGDLANIANEIGTASPYRRILRTEGSAGTVGNWITQDDKDPFQSFVQINFSKVDLITDNEKIEKSFYNFITTLRLYRSTEQGYFDDHSNVSVRDLIVMEISGGLDGFGHYFVKFAPSDCKTLN
jgi:hypothetical protein